MNQRPKKSRLEKIAKNLSESKLIKYNPLVWAVVGQYIPGKKQIEIAKRNKCSELKYCISVLAINTVGNSGKIFGLYHASKAVLEKSSNIYEAVAGFSAIALGAGWTLYGIGEIIGRSIYMAKTKKPFATLPVEVGYGAWGFIKKKIRNKKKTSY